VSIRDRVVVLVGGVGGAKLALGLARALPPGALKIIVNTADDFEHLGLHVSPDVDTLMYTLAGLQNPQFGWGVCDDTFRAMDMVERYGGPTWFRLGDRDLGTSLMRTSLLDSGHTLTDITRQLSRSLGVDQDLLPMSDDPIRTMLDTDAGTFDFQTYFVRERWQPTVQTVRFEGASEARPSPEVVRALDEATLIAFGPSNPYLSIAPILSVPGVRARIERADAPRVAVSPVIGGEAVKGPTAKLMREMGVDVSPVTVAHHYRSLIDGLMLDETDENLTAPIRAMGTAVLTYQTYMQTLDEKIDLAKTLLSWAEENLS
jgi:LPPG:FO 2-phospho-L-lactate transferase